MQAPRQTGSVQALRNSRLVEEIARMDGTPLPLTSNDLHARLGRSPILLRNAKGCVRFRMDCRATFPTTTKC